MKRRQALKQVVTSVGLMAATPSILSLLNACTSSSKTWTSEIIPIRFQNTIEILVNVILPETNSPSASELNVPQFVDKMMFHTENVLAQEQFVLGLEVFQKMLEKTFNKSQSKISAIEIETLFETLCMQSKGKEKAIYEQLDLPLIEIAKKNNDMYLVYYFITKLRYYCLLGYFTSQDIMEGVQDYNPNMGYYEGCINEPIQNNIF